MFKMRFKKRVAFVLSLFAKRVIKTRFCYIQQSEFRSVKQSRMDRDSIQDCNIDLST